MLSPRIILASTSPRRIELMKQVGFEIEVARPDTDETPKRGESPRKMVERLARDKASSVAQTVKGSALVVGSDTTVVAPDKKTVLGKPIDRADAVRILKKLVGKSHIVWTGYCVLSVVDGEVVKAHVRAVETRVQMRKLSGKQIEAYVDTGEPMDKAGSYAAQGIGMGMIEQIRGSYTNVVGLPMSQLMDDLEKLFKATP
jgi:septum formation protein